MKVVCTVAPGGGGGKSVPKQNRRGASFALHNISRDGDVKE